jgi:hypothetical protein
VPSTRSPLQAALSPQPSGGGFLRTAMATAAGVAGGALLFEGIRSLIGGNPGAFGPTMAQTPSPLLPPDTLPSAPLDGSPQDTTPLDTQQAMDDGQPQDEQYDDYDTASSDPDIGGSDDDWA